MCRMQRTKHHAIFLGPSSLLIKVELVNLVNKIMLMIFFSHLESWPANSQGW
jgi:hypothetical protein